MQTVGIEDAGRLVTVESGALDPDRLTLFAAMKDEMAFLPGWLEHHRRIGFEQFLIWDDGSTDGTADLLRAQPDVVTLRSDRGFGDPLIYRDPDGQAREERTGTYFKIAVPHVFLPGRFVGYLDADEFLILPPGIGSVAEVVARLRAEGAPSATASVVEFFPASADALGAAMPAGLDALLAAYPWFEAEPLVRLRPGRQPQLTGRSKTARLFETYGIAPRLERRGWHRLWMPAREKNAQRFQKSPRHKTPICLRDAETRLTGSHWGNRPPSGTVLLTVAHFVFTAQFADKIARATAWGAHANAAAKYRYYAELLAAMQGVPDGFLAPNSVRYSGPDDLIAAGLMRW